jgi:hypothetical protein
MASIRRLLAATVLVPDTTNTTAAVARELWRMIHQTRATISHYTRHGDPTPPRLRQQPALNNTTARSPPESSRPNQDLGM